MKAKHKRPAPVSKKQRKSSRQVTFQLAKGNRKNNRGANTIGKKTRVFSQRDTASKRNGKRHNDKHAGSLHRQVIVKTVEVNIPASYNKKGKMINLAHKVKRQIKKIVNSYR